MDHCDENADCYDVTGSYECHCHSGYRGDGFNCTGKYKIIFQNYNKVFKFTLINKNI